MAPSQKRSDIGAAVIHVLKEAGAKANYVDEESSSDATANNLYRKIAAEEEKERVVRYAFHPAKPFIY
jgi:hypothetical protein